MLIVHLAYDEEDNGFTFTRVKKLKQPKPQPAPEPAVAEPPIQTQQNVQRPVVAVSTSDAPKPNGDAARPVKKKPPKMSFSTPNPRDQQLLRRSKRISNEHEAQHASPKPKARRKEDLVQQPPEAIPQDKDTSGEQKGQSANQEQQQEPENATERDHAATKIALPFADTPVIRRNKAMRADKSGKGERRSSLSLRGRRASSLIDAGNSNALPHNEVEITDFFKHIESEGLPEPRRMKQLLTWCGTRSLDQKRKGVEFEDGTAMNAALVIEEELLKDLANRSELSDWFSREDVVEVPKELPERPNPKNLQNAEKIKELEEQIKRYVPICSQVLEPTNHIQTPVRTRCS